MPSDNPNPPALTGVTDIVHFDSGSLIIPMDNCYQRADKASPDSIVDAIVAVTYEGSETLSSAQCDGNSSRDSGAAEAYALVQRLVEANIPVYWALRENKPDFASYDFTITGGGSPPVEHMTIGGTLSNPYTSIGTIRYAGAPFIIDSSDAVAAKAAMSGWPYTDVSLHEAKTSFDAPIFKTMGAMPTMRILDLSASSGFLNEDSANLADVISDLSMGPAQGTWWDYVDLADVNNGDLVSDNVDLLWVPSFSVKTGGSAPVGTDLTDFQDMMTNLDAFADQGGSLVIHDEAIGVFEGEADTSGTPNASFPTWMPGTKFTHTSAGVTPAFFSTTWTSTVDGDDPSDPAAQFGGGVWSGIGGAKANWSSCGPGYRDGVRRMVYTVSGGANNNIELASWKHHEDIDSHGRIYYLGGNNWRKNTHTGMRLLMNTVFVDAGDVAGGASAEVTRSAPIVAVVGAAEYQFSGTFDASFPPTPALVYGGSSDDATFEFPNVTGHFRAVDTALLTAGTDYDATTGSALFDVDNQLKAMTINTSGSGCASVDGNCRFIFTNNGTTLVKLTEGNRSDFGSVFGSFTNSEEDFLIQRIHAGIKTGSSTYEPALGGVDRSTTAVIEASSIIGTPRATIAYFGGLDGMMHAVCADATLAPCIGKAGRELWAFMPRSQLPLVAANDTRIDGSPKVADVFADFGSGTKEYKTVLTFQSGSDDARYVYALDITDPTDPKVLWEYNTPGAGIGMAMGVTNIASQGLSNVSYVQTASGSTTSGMHLAALDSATGTVLWSKDHQYPPARGRVDVNSPSQAPSEVYTAVADVPSTGIPAGVTVFASDGQDIVDTVLAPSLWGSVWSLEAKDGKNNFGPASCGTAVWQNTAGCSPLFQFVDDYHPVGAPVSLYRDQTVQQLRAVVVTGGFVDQTAPTSTTWAPDAVHQFAVSFGIDATTTDSVIDGLADPTTGIHIDLGQDASGVAFRAFSQAVILGNEIFITSDSSDINSSAFGAGPATGQLTQVNLTSEARSDTTIRNGSASVDVSAGTSAVYTGGGEITLKTDISGYDTNGSTVEATEASNATRFLWLRK